MNKPKKLFRYREKIKFEDKEVTIFDRSVELLFRIENGEDISYKDILEDATDLTRDEISNLNIEALEYLINSIYTLEDKHLKKKRVAKMEKKKIKR